MWLVIRASPGGLGSSGPRCERQQGVRGEQIEGQRPVIARVCLFGMPGGAGRCLDWGTRATVVCSELGLSPAQN